MDWNEVHGLSESVLDISRPVPGWLGRLGRTPGTSPFHWSLRLRPLCSSALCELTIAFGRSFPVLLKFRSFHRIRFEVRFKSGSADARMLRPLCWPVVPHYLARWASRRETILGEEGSGEVSALTPDLNFEPGWPSGLLRAPLVLRPRFAVTRPVLPLSAPNSRVLPSLSLVPRC